MNANKAKGYEDWMKAIDAKISAKYGLTHDDLPDICYADMYEDGYTPAEAAKKAIANANGEDCE